MTTYVGYQIIRAPVSRRDLDETQLALDPYFFEHVVFPLLLDWRQTTAAILLNKAVVETSPDATRQLCLTAFNELKALEEEIGRAERPPFERWYRKTWVRNDDSPYNVHRSYERLLSFLIAHYLDPNGSR